MKKQNYIGLELARKLFENGCNIEGDKVFVYLIPSDEYIILPSEQYIKNRLPYAYSYYDIIVTHAREFLINPNRHNSIALNIIKHLQYGNNEEVDKLIWEFCKFNPENKEDR